MPEPVVIDARFHGPPTSANGGYACAMVAQFVNGPSEVTLRSPPPLDTPLDVRLGEGEAALLDGGQVVAAARRTQVDIDVPPPVTVEEARRAGARYPWRDRHPYPTCFVCGPDREPGDGLCLYPGPVDDGSRFAAAWTPDPSLADERGIVRPQFVWAALDCPSGIVTDLLGDDVGRMLLGRLSADLRGPVVAGEPHVVQAWPLGRDGRKLHTASAVFTAAGELRAVAQAVWIQVAGG